MVQLHAQYAQLCGCPISYRIMDEYGGFLFKTGDLLGRPMDATVTSLRV